MELSASTLCEGCSTLPWGEQGWKSFWDNESFRTRLHYLDFGTPYKSISYDIPSHRFFEQAKTCTWCRLLRDEMKTFENGPGKPPLHLYHAEPVQDKFKNLSFNLRFPRPENVFPEKLSMIKISCFVESSDGFTPMLLRLGVIVRPGGPAAKVFASAAQEVGTENRFNSQLANSWVDDCCKYHSNCGSGEPTKLPTRLLGIFTEHDRTKIRLIETLPDDRGMYACLSYSWGNRQDLQQEFIRLANDLSVGVLDMHVFPRTFQDALTVTQSLGLKYLWIDALCIRQEDASDKAKELPSMHLYYGNAYLVIQSSGTKSVDEGFLSRSRIPEIAQLLHDAENMKNLQSTFAKASIENNQPEQIHDLTFYELPFISPDGTPDSFFLYSEDLASTTLYNVNAEPAASRGWIIQEELLCRRILIFPSTGGMIFRCVSNDVELNDENVIYNAEAHRPTVFPKKRLLSQAKAESLGMNIFSDKTKGMVLQARKLAQAGNNPYVRIVGTSGILEINHEPNEPLEVPEDGFTIAPLYSDTIGPDGSSKRTVSQYAVVTIARNKSEDDGPELNGKVLYTDPPPHSILADGANRAWKDTVDDYCRRKLTNPDDKMIAIAALAREYSARYGNGLGRYVIGIWERFFPEGLLWKVSTYRREGRPKKQRAPSWSWMAVEGAVYDESDDVKAYDLNSSSIEIEIIQGKIHMKAEGLEYESTINGSFDIKGKVLGCSWADSNNRLALFDVSTEEQIGNRSYVLPDSDEEAQDAGKLKFLLVRRSNRGTGKHDDIFEGILLRTAEQGEHRRVGYGRFYYSKEDFEEKVASKFLEETVTIA